MNLPKFSKEWKWMAMDRNGNWYVFTIEPFRENGCWFVNLKKGHMVLVNVFDPVEDWEKSLIRINE
jgi:hypothetical protein